MLELAGGEQAQTAALCAAARPHLERVRAATSETTNLVILVGDRVVYVDQVARPAQHADVHRARQLRAAHTTGSGKAMLAYRPAETIARLYPRAREPFERLTPRTHTTLASLQDEFARVRRRGYALDDEEHEEGVSCVAAPVFDGPGRRSRRSASPHRRRGSSMPTPASSAGCWSASAEVSTALGYGRPAAACRPAG